MGGKRAWNIEVPKNAVEVKNPIRALVEKIGAPNPEKKVITLAQGDPTVFGYLPAPEAAVEAVVAATTSGRQNGYGHSCGSAECRSAVAEAHSPPGHRVTADDVFLTAGCSQGLEHAIGLLGTKGKNLLLPSPGFPLYETICEYYGIEPRFYQLRAEKDWSVDFDALRSLVDDHTVGILICNPSNPTGSNFSKQELESYISFAEENCLPIIADEVYEGMVFPGEKFYSMAELSERVPIISVGAISKRFLVPGWRLGWVILHDRNDILQAADFSHGMKGQHMIRLGPCSLIQAAVPEMLKKVDDSWLAGVMSKLEASAEVCIRRTEGIPGLFIAARPKGAMYVMIGVDFAHFPGVSDASEFAQKLFKGQSVMVLPGELFRAEGMFRLCFAGPPEVMEEAFDRIAEHCEEIGEQRSPSDRICTPQHQTMPNKRMKRVNSFVA
ncbi:hypothetical protein CYMTET_45120 [Cymbomonas tetramitiformis]|uniref:Aminotransferase class I/classII large domain-containing protein n=1 Tax=Cymbomonas tetramitiformis TaxID=36881 RepID=A0AAE0C034_9CHLO|nr:hypothetical protein CYMTET_45120 [Cymbomonas tetramitiformis]